MKMLAADLAQLKHKAKMEEVPKGWRDDEGWQVSNKDFFPPENEHIP